MFARIYQPAKTAMQSGKQKAKAWMLDYAPVRGGRSTDPLMGWTSSSDTLGSQVRLSFDTKEEAIAYAREKNIPFQVMERPETKPVLKSYAENFSYRRRLPWTH